MKIVVLCPTRERPETAKGAVESFLETSAHAEMVLVADHGDSTYDTFELPPRVRLIRYYGQQGPIAALNWAVTAVPADVYGMIPDDARFVTPGWDDYVAETFATFKGGIGAMSPAHPLGDFMQFPFVSAKWVATLGWMAPPGQYHFCWDTQIELMGDATQIVYPTSEQFTIRHDSVPPATPQKVYNDDVHRFLWWCVTGRREAVRALRQAIG